MSKLTEADVQRSLEAFAEGVEEVGPTVRDFQAARGLSTTSVATYHLKRLEREGLIERISPYQSRGYRLTAKGRALAAEHALQAAS